MFTGIIQNIGTITGVEKKGKFARIVIGHSGKFADMNIGDSIAVDGACLTVVEFSQSMIKTDVSEETLRLTTLGTMKTGEKVNLEKSLTPSTPMGGHFVTGHIDGVGNIARKAIEGAFAIIDFNIPNELQSQIVKKAL